MADTIRLAFFLRKKSTTPRYQSFDTSGLTDLFGKHARRTNKDGAMFSPAQLRPKTTRGNVNVESLVLLVADVDSAIDHEELRRTLDAYRYWLWSTHSYTPENGKMRVVVQLSCPVAAADWRDFWQRAQEHIFHGAMDEACKALSEAYFLPSAVPGAVVVTDFHEGRRLDPTELPPATRQHQGADPIPEVLHDTERNRYLLSLTGTLRRCGITTPVVQAILHVVNEMVCDPSLETERIDAIATSSSPWWEPPRADADTCASPHCAALLAEAMQQVWELNTQMSDEDAIMANRGLTIGRRLVKIAAGRRMDRERRAGRLMRFVDEGSGEIHENMAHAPKEGIAHAAGVTPKTVYTSIEQDKAAGLITDLVKAVVSPIIDRSTGKATEDIPHLTSFIGPTTGSTSDLRRAWATMTKAPSPVKLGRERPKNRAWEGHCDACPTHPFGATETQTFIVCAVCGRPTHPAEIGAQHSDQSVIVTDYSDNSRSNGHPPRGTYSFPHEITDYPPPDYEPPDDDGQTPVVEDGLSDFDRFALELFGGHIEPVMADGP